MAFSFVKYPVALNAKYLNDINDSVVGGVINSVPGASTTQAQQTLPGDRVCLDDATALALSDTAIGTLYGGIYMYVPTLSTATASPALGTIAFFVASQIGTSYQVSSDAQPTVTNPGYVCGVFINAITKGNFGWIQISGIATVLFDGTTLTATTAGGLVFAKVSATTASTADCITGTISGTHGAQMLGVAVGSPASSTASKVALTRGFGRL